MARERKDYVPNRQIAHPPQSLPIPSRVQRYMHTGIFATSTGRREETTSRGDERIDWEIPYLMEHHELAIAALDSVA